MIGHHNANFGAHRPGGSGDVMFYWLRSRIPHASRNPPLLFSPKHIKAHSVSYPGHTLPGIINHSAFAIKAFVSPFQSNHEKGKNKTTKVVAKLFQMQ